MQEQYYTKFHMLFVVGRVIVVITCRFWASKPQVAAKYIKHWKIRNLHV